MKRTRFQYRRWYVIDATPAQFGGLVEALNVLHATDEALQRLLSAQRPFHVYGLPLADNASLVTVRYPGGGEIGEQYRDPRFGWIDAMARLDGKTDLALAYNFSTSALPLERRLYLWQLLFDWLEESGCPVMAIDDAAPAGRGGEEKPATYPHTLTADDESKLRKLWSDNDLTKKEIAGSLCIGCERLDQLKDKYQLPDRKRGRKPGNKST